jgi:hypothetical protein
MDALTIDSIQYPMQSKVLDLSNMFTMGCENDMIGFAKPQQRHRELDVIDTVVKSVEGRICGPQGLRRYGRIL